MSHSCLYAFGQAALSSIIVFDLQSVNYHLYIMGFIAIELHTILYFTNLAIYTYLKESLLGNLLKEFAVMPLTRLYYGS